MQWTLERYLSSTIYEYNEAVKGYWRNWERQTAWLAREVVYSMICGNPHIEASAKPMSKEEFWKLSIDPTEKEIKRVRKKPRQWTEKEIKIFEELSFNKQ